MDHQKRKVPNDKPKLIKRDSKAKKINNQINVTGSKSNKKGIIDTPSDAEGFIEYPYVAPLTDTDLDGMPDEWEIAHGLNPNEPDNNRQFGEGYTVLENYLHYAMTGETMPGEIWAEGIEITNDQLPMTNKILRDGQLFIQRGAKTYTLQGQVIEAGK